MEENQVSNTSQWAAYMRAYHSRHATDKIFDDFLGYDLVPKELRERIEQQIIPEIFTRNQYYCQPCKVHRRYPSRSYLSSQVLSA